VIADNLLFFFYYYCYLSYIFQENVARPTFFYLWLGRGLNYIYITIWPCGKACLVFFTKFLRFILFNCKLTIQAITLKENFFFFFNFWVFDNKLAFHFEGVVTYI
jgi:hypothetical protein